MTDKIFDPAVRSLIISQAFDAVLINILQQQGYSTNLDDTHSALVAVKANATHCGPVARAVENHLIQMGIQNIHFHSLKGHYVVQDLHTGMLHDLECYAGTRKKEFLPLWLRGGGSDVPASAIEAWPTQRTAAMHGPTP